MTEEVTIEVVDPVEINEENTTGGCVTIGR